MAADNRKPLDQCPDITNEDPRPFAWTKTADRIPASVAHYCKRALDT